jgi:hypothetical protein
MKRLAHSDRLRPLARKNKCDAQRALLDHHGEFALAIGAGRLGCQGERGGPIEIGAFPLIDAEKAL